MAVRAHRVHTAPVSPMPISCPRMFERMSCRLLCGARLWRCRASSRAVLGGMWSARAHTTRGVARCAPGVTCLEHAQKAWRELDLTFVENGFSERTDRSERDPTTRNHRGGLKASRCSLVLGHASRRSPWLEQTRWRGTFAGGAAAFKRGPAPPEPPPPPSPIARTPAHNPSSTPTAPTERPCTSPVLLPHLPAGAATPATYPRDATAEPVADLIPPHPNPPTDRQPATESPADHALYRPLSHGCAPVMG